MQVVDQSEIQALHDLKSKKRVLDQEITQLEHEIQDERMIQSIKESIEALSDALMLGDFEMAITQSSKMVFNFQSRIRIGGGYIMILILIQA